MDVGESVKGRGRNEIGVWGVVNGVMHREMDGWAP